MPDFDAFREFAAGAPVPAVDPADIRRFRERFREIMSSNPQPAGVGGIGIDHRSFDGWCSPEANLPAVWFRNMVIELLLRLKLLNPWLQGDDLDEAVLRVAADFPIAGMGRFNPDEFLGRLRAESASN